MKVKHGEKKNMEKEKIKVIEFVNTAKKKESKFPWDDYEIPEKRYCVISAETGEVLDDAQGYGYKSIRKAYAGYAYKNRDKSKDKAKKALTKHIEKWMEENKSVVRDLDAALFYALKDGNNKALTPELVEEIFKENGVKPDFSAKNFIRVYNGKMASV